VSLTGQKSRRTESIALGFNAIDSVRLDFWPVSDTFRPGDDVRDTFRFYSPAAVYDRVQIRCWKKTDRLVDLASTGGHEVQFEGRRVFPHRLILRHYPIRGQAHGERKIFTERRPRFTAHERARGWHVQYDDAVEGQSFMRDSAALARYDADALRLVLAVARGTSERWEDLAGLTNRELRVRQQNAELAREDAQHALEVAREALVDARAGWAETRRQLEDAGALVERLQVEQTRAAAKAAEAAVNTAGLQTQLVEAREEAMAAHRANTDLAAQLQEIRDSLSWRWTAPVRRALGFMGLFR